MASLVLVVLVVSVALLVPLVFFVLLLYHSTPANQEPLPMTKYACDACSYIYDPLQGDPDNGVAPGTAWEDVPEDWVCPECGVGKDMFTAVD